MPTLLLLCLLLALACATSAPACLDRDGSPMDRWLILKPPSSFSYYSYEDNIVNPPNFMRAPDKLDQGITGRLMVTAQQAYSSNPDLFVALYSDEFGPTPVPSSFASARGLLVVSAASLQGFWLTHSVPQWPAAPGDSGSSGSPGAFPAAAAQWGHTLECVTVSARCVKKKCV